MENINLLQKNKLKKDKLENFNSDILDIVSKNIYIQRLIDTGILIIEDNVVTYLNKLNYTIEDILNLSGMYKQFVSLKKINIRLLGDSINIEFFGKLYSFEYTINLSKLTLSLDKSNTSLSNNISSFKLVYNTIKVARNKGFKFLRCFAGRDSGLMGYYYRPMLGFYADPDVDVKHVTTGSKCKEISDCKTLNELLDIKDSNGNEIGFNFWIENGFSFDAKFYLSDDSKSIDKLNNYIVSKKQSNLDKYKNIDILD